MKGQLCRVCIFQVANLSEMGQKVGPHNMMLVDICADHLTHLDEVFGQEAPVILADTPSFVETLVSIEGELFPLIL